MAALLAPTPRPCRFSLYRPAGQSGKGPESHPIPNGEAALAADDRSGRVTGSGIPHCSRGSQVTSHERAPGRSAAARRHLPPPPPGWHSHRPLHPLPVGTPSPPPEPAAPGGMSWAARVASASSKPAPAPSNGAAAADGTDKAAGPAQAAPAVPPAASSGVAGVKLPPGVEGACWAGFRRSCRRAQLALLERGPDASSCFSLVTRPASSPPRGTLHRQAAFHQVW